MASCIRRGVKYPTKKVADDICTQRNIRNVVLGYPLRWQAYQCERCSKFHVSSRRIKV